MNLYENQAKKIFLNYNLLIPKGYICNSKEELNIILTKINFGSWIIKCQIYAGNRNESGGIKVVKSKKEMLNFFEKWFGRKLITNQTNVNGEIVNSFLIEEVIKIKKEFYIGVLIDRNLCKIKFVASKNGGVNIEKNVKNNPKLIYTTIINPLIGPQIYQSREIAFNLGLYGKQIKHFEIFFINLFKMFFKLDFLLIEINPLVIDNFDNLICLDAKILTDENALFRQKELYKIFAEKIEKINKIHVKKKSINYIDENGNVACMVNGAGLSMATMDLIKLYHGKPANFLDIGGSITKDEIIGLFKTIFLNKKIKVVFINIFGGIVCCKLVAKSLIYVISKINSNISIVVRFEGKNAESAKNYLSDNEINVTISKNLNHAIKKVISYSRK